MDSDGEEPRPLSRRRRRIARLVRVPLLIYAGLAVFFFAVQTSLIFPGSETQGRPESVVQPPPGAELVKLSTPRGDRIVALFGPALTADGRPRPDAPGCPTLLYFYGNAMCLQDAVDQLERFRRLGVNVMIPDYLGYGMSGGRAGEAGCRETAEAAFAHLESRGDVDRSRIVAAGWSLGGAVAMDLADRRRVAGVAVFCTFTRMADMARRLVPFLPVSLLLRHRFDSLAKVPWVRCPILIGHGRLDGIIPYEMSDRLAEAAEGPVTRLTIEDADHNDFFDRGGSKVMAALGRFVEGLPPRE